MFGSLVGSTLGGMMGLWSEDEGGLNSPAGPTPNGENSPGGNPAPILNLS